MSQKKPINPRAAVAAVLLALCAVGAAAVAFSLDSPVRESVLAYQDPPKEWKKSPEALFHGYVRRYGDWPWLMLAGAAGFVLAWRLGRDRWMRVIAAAMIASTAAGLIVNMSRLTTGRTRPRASPKIEQGFYGPWHEGQLLIGNSAYNSFPSGHTATAFGMAWPFFAAGPVAGCVALAVAVTVAWSSIALGAHHLSDIVVSIAVSAFVAWLVWRWMRARGEATGRAILAKLSSWFQKARPRSTG